MITAGAVLGVHTGSQIGSEGALIARRAFELCRRLCSLEVQAAVNRSTVINNMVKKSELCDRYGVSRRTIENWMNSGILPFFKPSYGIVRFDLEACDRALGRFERNTAAANN